MEEDAGAPAAAPPPAPAHRQIAIPKNRKYKGAPPLTLEDVRNAAGVGGDAPAQPDADAPGAKFAYVRAQDTVRDLRLRDRWTADDDEFNAVRFFQLPLAEGGEPTFPMPPPPDAEEELLAPAAAGPTVLDRPLTDAGAPVCNAHSAPRAEGEWQTRSADPPKAPPLTPLEHGADLYRANGIPWHLVRASTVPTSDPDKKKGRSRLFATVYEEAYIKLEMHGEGSATPTFGWGPMITIDSTRTATKEVIHSHSADFVIIDYPNAYPDRVAIHRKGTRFDAAGVIFVESPVGAGPQMATFLHTFVYLSGGLPRRLRPTRDATQTSPLRSREGDAGFSLGFCDHDGTYARPGGPYNRGQVTDNVVHIVATGDARAHTASLTIRCNIDSSTWTTLDPKDAKVTVAEGAYGRPAVLLSLQSADSAGTPASFQRHIHSVSGLYAR